MCTAALPGVGIAEVLVAALVVAVLAAGDAQGGQQGVAAVKPLAVSAYTAAEADVTGGSVRLRAAVAVESA